MLAHKRNSCLCGGHISIILNNYISEGKFQKKCDVTFVSLKLKTSKNHDGKLRNIIFFYDIGFPWFTYIQAQFWRATSWTSSSFCGKLQENLPATNWDLNLLISQL